MRRITVFKLGKFTAVKIRVLQTYLEWIRPVAMNLKHTTNFPEKDSIIIFVSLQLSGVCPSLRFDVTSLVH